MLNDREHRSKFDPKSDEGMFLGYSLNNKAYKVFNKRKKTIMELANVFVDDQGTTSTDFRTYDSETEGPLCEPGDDASENDATPRSRPSPDIGDTPPSIESSSQSENPGTSTEGSSREASK